MDKKCKQNDKTVVKSNKIKFARSSKNYIFYPFSMEINKKNPQLGGFFTILSKFFNYA
jgi:hypothetical protein